MIQREAHKDKTLKMSYIFLHDMPLGDSGSTKNGSQVLW